MKRCVSEMVRLIGKDEIFGFAFDQLPVFRKQLAEFAADLPLKNLIIRDRAESFQQTPDLFYRTPVEKASVGIEIEIIVKTDDRKLSAGE